MNVDTGAFRALTDEVAGLAEQVRQLNVKEIAADVFFQAGYAAGETHTREALLGRAARTAGTARRPRRLRSVDGGQP